MNTIERAGQIFEKDFKAPTPPEARMEKPNKVAEATIESGGDNEVEDVRDAMDEGRKQRGSLARDIFTSQIVRNGLDVLPYIGGGKMLLEAMSGGATPEKRLTGKERVIHGATGAGILAMDITGGRAFAFAGKSVPLIKRLGVALAERGALKGAAILARTGEFMAKHPKLVLEAERYAEVRVRTYLAEHKQNV